MSDQVVTLPPDSTGKAVDVSEVTRQDGTSVERQRVNLSDPVNATMHARVGVAPQGADAGVVVKVADLTKTNELLAAMVERLDLLIELTQR